MNLNSNLNMQIPSFRILSQCKDMNIEPIYSGDGKVNYIVHFWDSDNYEKRKSLWHGVINREELNQCLKEIEDACINENNN